MSTSNQFDISNRKSYKIASIPGDGIGPDVISAGIKILENTSYKKHGKYLPDDALEIVREFEAVFFGCAGDVEVPDHISLWNCERGDLDWVIIRENSEGEYAGHGGTSHKGEKWAVATETTMTTKMVLQPRSIDTIVATNLHADILSDLAAALAGSIGIAPTSNLDPTRNNPSMFEPIHGSAFDLVGKGLANPVGTFWSAAEMLRWLGEGYAADLLMESVENVLESGVKTLDLGGQAKTHEVVDAVFCGD
ncbi:hypothetical protein DID88_006491 [Monilinia fructigena]|uniref:Isopropylmalate dehydrogenase-like domain-containing protein n=1 Tax=Monilinia fructigena TaxID=38457 RepID=A0A395IH20_9HELO|nr:hypothetical protein DID88_006491 [Monilinia fructigena]